MCPGMCYAESGKRMIGIFRFPVKAFNCAVSAAVIKNFDCLFERYIIKLRDVGD